MTQINRLLAVFAVAITLIAGTRVYDAYSVTQVSTRSLCDTRPYPRLHFVLKDYAQLRNWRSECSQHPRQIHKLLTTGCNNYECNYSSGLAYRRWIRRFVHTHGGIPYGDILLGA